MNNHMVKTDIGYVLKLESNFLSSTKTVYVSNLDRLSSIPTVEFTEKISHALIFNKLDALLIKDLMKSGRAVPKDDNYKFIINQVYMQKVKTNLSVMEIE